MDSRELGNSFLFVEFAWLKQAQRWLLPRVCALDFSQFIRRYNEKVGITKWAISPAPLKLTTLNILPCCDHFNSNSYIPLVFTSENGKEAREEELYLQIIFALLVRKFNVLQANSESLRKGLFLPSYILRRPLKMITNFTT